MEEDEHEDEDQEDEFHGAEDSAADDSSTARISAREAQMAIEPYNTSFWVIVYPWIISTALVRLTLPADTYPILALSNCKCLMAPRDIPSMKPLPQPQSPRTATPKVLGHLTGMASSGKRNARKSLPRKHKKPPLLNFASQVILRSYANQNHTYSFSRQDP